MCTCAGTRAGIAGAAEWEARRCGNGAGSGGNSGMLLRVRL